MFNSQLRRTKFRFTIPDERFAHRRFGPGQPFFGFSEFVLIPGPPQKHLDHRETNPLVLLDPVCAVICSAMATNWLMACGAPEANAVLSCGPFDIKAKRESTIFRIFPRCLPNNGIAKVGTLLVNQGHGYAISVRRVCLTLEGPPIRDFRNQKRGVLPWPSLRIR